ncbi:MAG: 16S rRNA (cytosine(1402)-N(4))-methyltransferase RsmH [Oscillospiraceae bacterium]|nr:16S rRNA (cytosine(1402)-N(4))-methyltransferase RsmH [Oscillospiraceae bacterium]
MSTEQSHRPVLLTESVDALAIRPEGRYVDGTLGRGGHAAEIARRLTAGGRLLCIDRDEAAFAGAADRLAFCADRITFLHGNFRDLSRLMDEAGMDLADGMLFDLGVSSPQLDDGERGFSYLHDAPLDMRMDRREGLTARTVVNEWPEADLKRILYTYGEERYAPAIARAIVQRRAREPIETTGELAELIRGAMPGAALREAQHPAKRTFQAIRIAVNDELAAVEELIPVAVERLAPGGRLAVITFHSLEDRIVKQSLQGLAKGCICPPDFPVCTCGQSPKVRLVTRKPIQAAPGELEENPRARSAKLRVAERI